MTLEETEGFEEIPYFLPQSLDEGGGYGETCASIGCMMVCERLLSHRRDGKWRDTLERCFFNAVLGGASLDGKRYTYENRLATWGDETCLREPWFESESEASEGLKLLNEYIASCCPPNLARTIGCLGGYTWASALDEGNKRINLAVYLFVAAEKSIALPDGTTARVRMTTQMPWTGNVELSVIAPDSWSWSVAVPDPSWAANVKVS